MQLKDAKEVSFVKEIATYFMNFLETDFKKRRLPKRNTASTFIDGLKGGINLKKYPKLKRNFLLILNKGFNKGGFQVKKGEYVNPLSERVFNLIDLRIKEFSKKDLDELFDKIEKKIKENKKYTKGNRYKFLEESKKYTKDIFLKDLINLILNELDKSQLDIDDNSKLQLETDIKESVFSDFWDSYEETLLNFLQHRDNFNLKENLQKTIELDNIKDSLIKFFKDYRVGDVFDDIYQLDKNSGLVENTEIYLYFYELSLNNDRFPVFYIPTAITIEEDKFIFKFENRLFINTKAIDFVAQEFNKHMGRQATLVGEIERILYIDKENDFFDTLESCIRKIENFFGFKHLDLKESKPQKYENLIASFSNDGYLFLFDKSDEALINDYEEILNDNGDILENFSSLVNGFIDENPKSFVSEVEDEWHKKDISKKLIFQSPIPLNDEQKQVLIALKKPNCNFMILSGPPGTGKSHTITAVICKKLLEGKSILVLSDKKEALDVVEEKISTTLNKIRNEDNFQNPILRLGRTGNKLYKIVQRQTIQKIKEHYNAYRHKKGEFDGNIEERLSELEKNIKESVDYFNAIKIKDVESFFQNFNKFSTFNWLTSPREYSINLLRIKRATQELCRHDSSFKIDRKLLDDLNYQLLEKYQRYLKILNELKSTLKQKNKTSIAVDFEIKELSSHTYDKSILEHLYSARKILFKLDDLYETKFVVSELFKPKTRLDLDSLRWCLKTIDNSLDKLFESKKYLGESFNSYCIFSNFEFSKQTDFKKIIAELRKYVDVLNTIKQPVIGFLFKDKQVKKATKNLKETFSYFNIDRPQKDIKKIEKVFELFCFIEKKINEENAGSDTCSIFRILIDLLCNSNYLSSHQDIKTQLKRLIEKIELIDKINPSIFDGYDLEVLIEKVDFNIQAHETINNIRPIISKLSNIIPVNIRVNSYEDYTALFSDKTGLHLSKIIKKVEGLHRLRDDVDFVLDIAKGYPNLSKEINLVISAKDITKASSILSNYKDEEIKKYQEYKKLQLDLENQFKNCPKDKFFNSIRELESLITTRMISFLDKSIIEYTENYANEVATLKNIVSKKRKFPKALFQNLKKAFPCILAGVRDYAEFIPLEKTCLT